MFFGMVIRKFAVFFLSLLFLSALITYESQAVEVQERLSSEVLENKAQEIGREIKCPTCHGQSIEESNAEVASVLRQLVRQNVEAGRTKDEIFSFLTEVYGDAVLFNPSWSFETLILWLFPFLFLIIFFYLLYRRFS